MELKRAIEPGFLAPVWAPVPRTAPWEQLGVEPRNRLKTRDGGRSQVSQVGISALWAVFWRRPGSSGAVRNATRAANRLSVERGQSLRAWASIFTVSADRQR